jgi:hypothetical protein
MNRSDSRTRLTIISISFSVLVLTSPWLASAFAAFTDPTCIPFTAGTTPALGLAANPARIGIIIENKSTTATIDFCTVNSGITPSIGVAGCIDLLPLGSMVITGGVIKITSGLNFISSAASTPVTIWSFP